MIMEHEMLYLYIFPRSYLEEMRAALEKQSIFGTFFSDDICNRREKIFHLSFAIR
jgi:hypothetical protein